MEKTVQKYRADLLFWTGLILAYFATRLPRLDLIPIFTDEAIYLRWSQIMAHDASLRYLPLVDGKPPLFMWLTSAVMRLLPHIDPLLTGRLVSTAAGFAGLIGIYFLATVIFKNKNIARLSALFYLLVPFTFFYDRFGLADSLLSMLGIWALALAVLLTKSLRLDVSLILGAVLGFGLLTKTPAVFFYGFLPLSLLLFPITGKDLPIRLLKWVGLVLLVVAISQMFYGVLRLFPLFNMIAQKNAEFILSPKEFLRHPLESLPGNISSLLRWEIAYLTLPIALLAVVSTALAIKHRSTAGILLFLAASGQFLVIALFNSSIFPRFLLQLTPPILVLVSWGLWHVIAESKKLKRWLVVIIAAAFAIPLFIDFQLLTDPPRALIADGDSNQYLNAWPAGYGVVEIRRFLQEQSTRYPSITIGTEGTFGLMPYALQLYQKDYPNVVIKDYWPLPDKVPPELNKDTRLHPTYFIIYQQQTVPLGWKVVEVASFREGIGKDHLRLYQILPQS